ncbi:hypothetical protein Chor_003110 [Crotalus horridus]
MPAGRDTDTSKHLQALDRKRGRRNRSQICYVHLPIGIVGERVNRKSYLFHVFLQCKETSVSTAITSAKVEVNGVHLHYQQTGNGNHAVLLLPGMLGSGQTDFEPQLKNMNKEIFTIVAWDPRGYGKSIPPVRDYPLDYFERDAKDAVDLMQVKSIGAKISETAIRDVSKWSEKVRKPLEEMYGYEYLSKMCSAWVDGISQFTQKSDGDICQLLLTHIKCPTLIIHGEKDPLVPRFHAEYIHKRIKGSRLHFMPEGKHNLHLRFAEEFKKMVEEFLV